MALLKSAAAVRGNEGSPRWDGRGGGERREERRWGEEGIIVWIGLGFAA